MKNLEPITELICQILDNCQAPHPNSTHEEKQKNSDIQAESFFLPIKSDWPKSITSVLSALKKRKFL